MDKSWEINEKECFLYLTNNHGNKFILEGLHNSNISDIKVKNKNFGADPDNLNLLKFKYET